MSNKVDITKGFFIALTALGLVNALALAYLGGGEEAGEDRYRLVCSGKTIAETSSQITSGSSGHYSADGWDYWPNHGDFCTITEFKHVDDGKGEEQ